MLALLALLTAAVARPLEPRQASFYGVPSDLASQSNGYVFSARSFVPTYNGKALNVVAHQLLYRTQAATGNSTAMATVATVFVPQGAQPNKLVSYAQAEDADNTACSPSEHYYAGMSSTNVEDIYVLAFLNLNYTVVSSDYEGPNSAYVAGRLMGHGVLDGIRAALNYAPLGFSSKAEVVAVGYSGGATATGWAAALQSSYAPELNIVGYATGGTPSNISETLQYIDGGLYSGFVFAGMGGIAASYQAFSDRLNAFLTPAGAAAINYIQNNCNFLYNYAFKEFESTTYNTLGSQYVYDPVISGVLADLVMGVNANETPTAPYFLYHTRLDEIIPVASAEVLYSRYCANGIKSLRFTINNGPAEHTSAAILFIPDVLDFVQDRFNGVAPVNGCSMNSTVLPLIDPGTAPADRQLIYGEALDLLNTQVGPSDNILNSALSSAAVAAGNTPTPTAAVQATASVAVTASVGV